MHLDIRHLISGLLSTQLSIPTSAWRSASQIELGTSQQQYHKHNRRGAVASESRICSEIGLNVFKAGGNAADSMVATTFCVGVIGMYHSGIGGGGFMLARSSSGEYEHIDFRETAPAAAFEDMFKDNINGSIRGGLASGVPGEVKGLAYLHQNYGSLPWRDLVLPAAQVARHGFRVTEDLIRYMAFANSHGNNFLIDEPDWAIDFAPDGVLLQLNDTITRKRYATTLEHIADYGPEAFYSGRIAETIIDTIRQTGGIMTLEDLGDYTVSVRDAVSITYRGYKIYGGRAPSSGSVALSALKIIEGYPDIGSPDALNLSTHRFDEAIRFAYGQRTELGDPAYVNTTDQYEKDMLEDYTVDAIRAKINDAHTLNISAYNPSGFEVVDTPGTSGIVTSDHSGMAISLTTTVNLLFGSQVMVPETGIILNNEMNDFSIPGKPNEFGYRPSVPNYIRPGKRMLSSITTNIVEHKNGTLYMVVAAAGGSRIITAVLQSIWNMLDRGMTTHEALAEPRFHDQLSPNVATFEYAFDNRTVDFMRGRGHNVSWVPPIYSATQALRQFWDGTFEASGEPRQKNSAGLTL